MKMPMKSSRKTTGALAVTSVALMTTVALMGSGHAQDNQRQPMPVPHADPKQVPEPAASASTRITGKVQSVDGHLLTLTDGVQLVFFPGFTEQHGELKPGATIKASYAETAGRKVVTSIQVDPL
jgi:hypothetical protein